jgi:hypothetical protein
MSMLIEAPSVTPSRRRVIRGAVGCLPLGVAGCAGPGEDEDDED